MQKIELGPKSQWGDSTSFPATNEGHLSSHKYAFPHVFSMVLSEKSSFCSSVKSRDLKEAKKKGVNKMDENGKNGSK